MIKILQYGEGNFLRAFVDDYFNELNNEGAKYSISIVKPRPHGSLEKYTKQKNEYHVVLRGSKNGTIIESVKKITVLEKVFSPFDNYSEYLSIAKDPELKIIISNTTEAGICYNQNDKFDDFDNMTFPAKLTKLLYERFLSKQDGVYILPVELIENNADELKKCVDLYIKLWELPEDFKVWNNKSNYYCNTLVDRIVSGYPKSSKELENIEQLIGQKDELLTIGEPFGLWAIEKKGEIDKYIKDGVHGIEVVLTNDIGYYKKRKVRVLNGSHTNIVPVGLMLGAVTVYDCMIDKKLKQFLKDTLTEEIIPFVSYDISATQKFATSVIDRFSNPFLNHQLTSIALNSISKWKARILPSFKDYYNANGKIPKYLTIGFSYLMALYSKIQKTSNGFVVELENGAVQIQDDLQYLEYFANGGNVIDFMSNISIWGEDLTNYFDFCETVMSNIEKIKKGVYLI